MSDTKTPDNALSDSANSLSADVSPTQLIEEAQRVIKAEADALMILASSIGESLVQVVHKIVALRGRVIVTGVGKSGHIARKISSTLSSTGTPSYFVHASDSSHGDLGMITNQDLVIMISNSGNTRELSDIISYTKKFAVATIGITSVAHSVLARSVDLVLSIPNLPEVCPLGLAPTTSTTCSLALGDAIAVSVMKLRGFTKEGFKNFHPGGSLGAKLLRVTNVMKDFTKLPLVAPDSLLLDLIEQQRFQFGLVGVVNTAGELVGVVSDGDIRRNVRSIENKRAQDMMTKTPKVLPKDALVEDVMRMFREHAITAVFVVENKKPIGLVHIHDLLQSGV